MIDLILSALIYFPTESSVEVDPTVDGYRVTGELFLDQTFTGSQNTKKVAATCKDCRWLVSSYCKRESPFETISACELPTLECETGYLSGVKMRIWRQLSQLAAWEDQGIVCIGPKGPVNEKVISESIKEEVIVYLPALNPTSQPSNQALVKLPVNFLSNQPKQFGPTVIQVSGIEVELVAWPSWTWQFSNQKTLSTNQAGALYPDLQITHTFNKSGTYKIEVSTKWSAQWRINDPEAASPPRLVDELVQKSAISLQIRPAWGQLTR